MSPRLVRRLVVAVCVAGIAGMIATSIADAPGAAVAFGLVSSAAVLTLIAVTAVSAGAPADTPQLDEQQALALEAMVNDLVRSGVDEARLRAVVRSAVRLGRSGGVGG